MILPKITIAFPVIGEDQFLVSCLDSIRELDYPKDRVEIILIDNGIKPFLKKKIVHNFPQISWLGKGENLGFALANNLGLEKAKGEWIFVTNSDVRFNKKCLLNLIKSGSVDSKIGILGPLVYSLAKPSEISPQDNPGFQSDFFWGQPRSLSVKELAKLRRPLAVDWISGSGIMIQKGVIDKIGLFDERFFAYWEDADFCLRAKKAGFKVVLVPEAKIFHQGSVIMGKISPEHTYYVVRNGLLFLFKYTSLVGRLTLHLRNLTVLLVKLLKVALGVGRDDNLAFIAGILDFYRGKWGKRR